MRAAVATYRKLPHTATGESPMFLHTGQEPTYSIDHLLPIKSREVWQKETNSLDLSQLHVAHALARKNLCLARKRAKRNELGEVNDHKLQIGDRVFRKNHSSHLTKADLKWLPGYRVTGFESSRTAWIKHSIGGLKARVNVRDLRWADPVSELLMNSNLDVFPGESKLYFSAEDLKDLNWDMLDDLPELDPTLKQKANEIVRDRASDLTVQKPPTKRPRLSGDPPEGASRPTRERRRNVRLKGYIVGFAKPLKPNVLVHCKPTLTIKLVSENGSGSRRQTRWDQAGPEPEGTKQNCTKDRAQPATSPQSGTKDRARPPRARRGRSRDRAEPSSDRKRRRQHTKDRVPAANDSRTSHKHRN